ncbi:MAG: YdcF family protein [Acidobacteriota bacterium]|nr:YdcF family protein [Acidobacteriota bacterium]
MSVVLRRRWLWIMAAALLTIYIVFFAVTCARIAAQSQRDEAHAADAIVVFGAAEYFGKPSPVYRARLDHAYELYMQGLAPVVITTGGSGGEESFTEGAVGRDYLISLGIPDAHMIAETQSDNSAESAERIGRIMATNNMHSCIAVSDPYHEYRIKRLLQAQGRQVYTSPRRNEFDPGLAERQTRIVREALSYTLWRLHVFHR